MRSTVMKWNKQKKRLWNPEGTAGYQKGAGGVRGEGDKGIKNPVTLMSTEKCIKSSHHDSEHLKLV